MHITHPATGVMVTTGLGQFDADSERSGISLAAARGERVTVAYFGMVLEQ